VTEWISVEEAASLTGYDNEYLWWLCRTERITCKKLGRMWFIDKENLQDYRARMEGRPGGGPRKKDN